LTQATPPGAKTRRRGGVQNNSGDHLAPDVAAIKLAGLHRIRKFAIKAQSRADRSVESFIAGMLGYRREMTETERRNVYAAAGRLRKAIEDGRDIPEQFQEVCQTCAPLVFASKSARIPWDRIRESAEDEMRRLVATLPVWSFVQNVRGLGELGLATIIAETGDLSNYATKERVWKRLGLAVIQGERQRRVRSAEEAELHGYNPERRAWIWAITDSMFRHQWAGDKDENGKNPVLSKLPVAVPAHPTGPYGEVYQARKQATADRLDWSPGRRENDARRIMSKELVKHLWQHWRRAARMETV
jgi:hypothetical protein